MAVNWFASFKDVPWSKVIGMAPTIVENGKKLWDKVSSRTGGDGSGETTRSAAQLPVPAAIAAFELRLEALEKKSAQLREEAVASFDVVRSITDQHSQLQLYMEGPDDKVVDFIRVERFSKPAAIPRLYEGDEAVGYLGGRELSELLLAEERATEMALAKKGRMNSTIVLDSISPQAIGQILFMFEIETVFAAGLYRVNPFDQPGVEKGKRLTYGMMGRPGYRKEKQEVLAMQRKKKERFVL